MDLTRWKFILFEWVKSTQLVDVTGSLEHIDIQQFYQGFKTKTDPGLDKDLVEFLEEHFPKFEVLYDEARNISSQDFVYIFSLILYYSCVFRVNAYFQKCCQSLDSKYQPILIKFFASLRLSSEIKEPITKEVLRLAIKEASPSPLALRFLCSSPLKTPERTAPTPSRLFYQEKAKELQKVKTLLENERYERSVLEGECKTNEDKVQSLVKEQKSLKQEVHKLRTEQMLDRDNENLSPNKAIRDEQVRSKMQKEIDAREEVIVNLKCEIDVLTSKNEKCTNRQAMTEREMKELRSRINDLEIMIHELQGFLEDKQHRIQVLEEINGELQSFINETRRSRMNKDSSSDCLDFSFSTFNTGGNSTDSGENLAKTVIDIQLKEKEIENLNLKEQLATVSDELKAARDARGEFQEMLESERVSFANLRKDLEQETLETSTRNEDLKAELDEMSTQLQAKISEVYSLQKEVENVNEKTAKDMESLISAKDNTLFKMEMQLQAKCKESENARKKIDSSCQSKVQHMNSKIDELRSAIAAQEVKVDSLETLVERIEREKSALMKTISDKDTELANNNRENDSKHLELSKNAAKLLKELELTTSKSEEILSGYHSKNIEIEGLKQELAKLTQLNADRDGELQQIIKQKAELEKDFNVKSSDLDNAKEKLSELSTSLTRKQENSAEDMKNLQDKLNLANEDIEEKQSLINQQKISIEALNIETIESLKKSNKIIDELNVQLASKTTEIQAATVDIESKTETLKKLEASLSQLQVDLKTSDDLAQQASKSLQSRIDELQTEIAEVTAEKLSVMQGKSEAEKILIAKSSEIESAKNQILSQTEALKKLAMTLSDREAELKESRDQVKCSAKQLTVLQSRIVELDLQVATKAAENASMDQEKSEIKTEYEEFLQEHKNLATQLEAKELEVVKLKAMMETAYSSMTSMTEYNKKVEERLDNLTKAQSDYMSKEDFVKQGIERLHQTLKETSAAKEKLEATVNEADKKMKEATSESEKLVEANKELIAKVDAMDLTITDLKKSLTNKEELLTTLADQEVEAEKKTFKFKLLSDSLKQEVARHIEEISHLKQVISDKELHIENIELEKSLSFEKKESVTRMKAIVDKELEESKSTIAMKITEIEKLNADVQVKNEKISSLEKLVEQLRVEVTGLNERIVKERVESSSLKLKIRESEEMVTGVYVNIDELKDQKTKLYEKLKATENEKQCVDVKVSELNEQLSNAKNELTQKMTQVVNVEAQLIIMKESIQRSAEVKVNYEMLDTQYNVLKERADSLEQTVETKDDAIVKLKSEVEANQKMIDELNNNSNQKNSELQDKIRDGDEKIQQNMSELENLQTKLSKLEKESQQACSSNDAQRLELESQHSQTIEELKTKIEESNAKNAEKEAMLFEMLTEMDNLKVVYREQINGLEQQLEVGKAATGVDNVRVEQLLSKIAKYEGLEKKVQELEKEHLIENEFNKRLAADNSVLSAKLMKTREENNELVKKFESEMKKVQTEAEEVRRKCDEEIKESRIEDEGKLEKMKERMRLIYNGEMDKKQTKHEERLAEVRNNLKSLYEKAHGLELHNEKLTRQNFEMKSIVLDNNTMLNEISFLKSKLRFIEINGSTQSSSSIGMSKRPSTITQMNGANLGMEDEAGEEFKNTYLADLQTGGSQFSLDRNNPGSNIYSATELQKRNSMYPVNMRSSYAIGEMDRNLMEQEIRDGGILDDSQAALLQKANRKKPSTSYKRPGPPTPSKLGGRLSVGGNEFNFNMNVLKDSNNVESIAKKTPGSRLKSLFGGSKVNDENHKPSPRRLSFLTRKK